MTINYTTLLGLAKPVTGTEANTWGDAVNDQITDLLDSAVAGAATISLTAGNVTLTSTNGAADQARMAILILTGTPGTTRNVVAPSKSKTYIVVNQSDSSAVVKGSATTGVTVRSGQAATCVWNGTDFEIVASGDVDGPASATNTAVPTFDGTTGKLIQNNSGVTIAANVVTATGFTGALNGTVGATTPTTVVATQIDITAQGDLRLQDTTGGQYVALQAPSTLAANYTLTFPGDDGTAGQALITDGTGVLSFSSLTVGDVVGPASATDNAIARFDLATGKLIQNSLVTVADDGAITAPGVSSVIPFYYANQAAFPSASTYHGAVAHSHADGAMYFAHAGVWTRMLNDGGPLGTPSSGTVTNLTGTASINVNGTVGATTPSTGAFTNFTASGTASFTSTGAVVVSSGTTGQRPTPATAMFRFNTTTVKFEGYNGTVWGSIGGGATITNDTTTASNVFPAFLNATSGEATDLFTSNARLLYKPSTGELQSTALVASNGIVVNSATVAADYTISSGNNAMSAGPVTINSGIVVTVSSGSVWVVV